MTVSQQAPTERKTIGLLHPGAMGAELGRVLRNEGHQVLWCTAGRSHESRERADDAGLEPLDELAVLTRRSDVVVGTGALATEVVSDVIGEASAVKVAFAAWTKGSTALRTAVLAYARTAGVESVLEEQWERLQPGFWEEGRNRAVSVTAKAWRFDAEMREIADAFDALGLPSGFHRTAADVYRSMASLRDKEVVDVDAVVAAIAGGGPAT